MYLCIYVYNINICMYIFIGPEYRVSYAALFRVSVSEFQQKYR